jgi:hypothetical protein
MMKMKRYQVIEGDYAGRIGCGEATKYGTVMFYPDGGAPYRVCLSNDKVVEIREEVVR